MKRLIQTTIAEINANIEAINSNPLIESNEREDAINNLQKAKQSLRNAKFYLGLAEESVATNGVLISA